MQRAPFAIIENLILTAAVAGLSVATWGIGSIALAQQPAPFAITKVAPNELNPAGGGPAQATLQQAAEFAWEEFFALSWPAGPNPTARDTPSASCAFGDQSQNCGGPLVWQTFRGKVEIFPGDGNPPPGYSSTDPSFGYDAPPQYTYGAIHRPVICQNPTPLPPTAWVNLDETDQISVDSMYAGVVSVPPSPLNSAPQLIRFVAKANRAEYVYIAKHGWWGDKAPNKAPTAATAAYVKQNMRDPPDGNNYVLLPPNGDTTLPGNSIEVKAGWRVLNPSEMSSGRFHTTTVRYYEKENGQTCYQQATFGLVSLHIIQKTPLAPYFIYASFEQADNILDANGNPVEDADGNVALTPPCRSDQKSPCPTTPSVTLNDTATVNAPSYVPPQVVLDPSTAAYCTSSTSTPPPNQLFYLNTSGLAGLPTGGYICVNTRDNAIPQVIIDTNNKAHNLIRTYSGQNGVQNSVWQYYKLINVQYQPIDKDHAGLYGPPNPGEDNPSTYYLANIVVETNRPLQLFSGSLVGGGATGSNSDYDSQFGGQQAPSIIHRNVMYQGKGYNMGGCMGCHAAQGQAAGGDFSVIVARGTVGIAETPAPPTSVGAAVVPRNRSLK
jgi:hypothetical protein